jgi:hypothetical protein
MRSIISIFGCCILFQLASCVSPINCRKQFTVYKEPIIKSSRNIHSFNNGIFVSINGEDVLYLFDNGLSKTISSSISTNQEFWLYPEKAIDNIIADDDYFKKEIWGHYQIIYDTIIIQTFGLANDQLCRRSVYETRGIILNDSTIKVFSDFSHWFNYEIIKEPNIFRHFTTDYKPDRSLAWFNKKRWYKKNLHESRR